MAIIVAFFLITYIRRLLPVWRSPLNISCGMTIIHYTKWRFRTVISEVGKSESVFLIIYAPLVAFYHFMLFHFWNPSVWTFWKFHLVWVFPYSKWLQTLWMLFLFAINLQYFLNLLCLIRCWTKDLRFQASINTISFSHLTMRHSFTQLAKFF